MIALDDVMLEDDSMDISDSEIPENLLDVLYKNCRMYGCCLELGCLDPGNIFNVQKPKREFQCPKCSRLWHKTCMEGVALENKCMDFDASSPDVCINCFLDNKLFHTASYKYKSQFTKEEKTWKRKHDI